MANPNCDDDGAAALKQQQRRRLKLIRQRIDPARRKEAAELACQTLTALTQHSLFILSFASFGSEIDLWSLNQRLANEGRLVLPRIVDQALHFYQVRHFNQLETHSLGMLEPIPTRCNLVDLSDIEIALIPGLGFDPNTKTRLGYGGGYYDRLLAKNTFIQSWGIGFREQAVEGLPSTPQDKPLSKIFLF